MSEYHSEIVALLNETNDMDVAAIAQQVPELDSLFYHGLIDRLKQRRELVKLTQYNPSTNLGENMAHLQAMFNAAKNAEHVYQS